LCHLNARIEAKLSQWCERMCCIGVVEFAGITERRVVPDQFGQPPIQSARLDVNHWCESRLSTDTPPTDLAIPAKSDLRPDEVVIDFGIPLADLVDAVRQKAGIKTVEGILIGELRIPHTDQPFKDSAVVERVPAVDVHHFHIRPARPVGDGDFFKEDREVGQKVAKVRPDIGIQDWDCPGQS